MDRHLSSFPIIGLITKQLVSKVLQCEAPPEKDPRFSILLGIVTNENLKGIRNRKESNHWIFLISFEFRDCITFVST